MKIRELTFEQLKFLIDEAVQDKLEEVLGDPDEGLEIREEIIKELKVQRKHTRKTIPGEEIMKQYGLGPK